MKRYLFLVATALFSLQAPAQSEADMQHLIRELQFVQAQEALKTYAGPHKLVYDALISNAFMKTQHSYAAVNLIAPDSLTDSLRFVCTRVNYDNAVKLGLYAEAFRLGKELTTRYSSYYPADRIQDEIEAVKIWKSLQHSRSPRVQKSGDSHLSFAKDLAGLHTLPVRIGKGVHPFVFDTGAGMNCLTQTYAQKLGARILSKEPIYVKGGTGHRNQVQIGIVPRLRFGKVTVHDAAFLVFPDSAFTFAGGAYRIDGIIGFPTISALGCIEMTADSITIPQQAPEIPGIRPNLAFDELSPILYLRVFDTELPCLLDTGDNDFSFNKTFHTRFADRLTGERKTLQSGGAGGQRSYDALLATPFPITIGNQTLTPTTITVDTQHQHIHSPYLYGNIGQGILGKFRMTRIDFVNGVLTVE